MLNAVRSMVIVKVIYEEKEGSVIIPDGAKQYNGAFYGEVISVGPEYPYDLKPRDKIAYVRHEGSPVIIGEEEFIALKERWVLAKLEEG